MTSDSCTYGGLDYAPAPACPVLSEALYETNSESRAARPQKPDTYIVHSEPKPQDVLLTQTSLGNGRHDPVGRISDAASRNTSQGPNKESGAQLNVYHPKD